MAFALRTAKPKFGPAELWGACSRCGARVKHNTLRRERLTGLLMCSEASGRPVKSCWDPWPAVYDFQAYPDNSINPPPEPLPARWNLDDVWGSADNPAPAPDDATRLQNLLTSVPYYGTLGRSAAFMAPNTTLGAEVFKLTTIVAADYDGTFVPSNSVRTVTPTLAPAADVPRSDPDLPNDTLIAWPWSAVKGV